MSRDYSIERLAQSEEFRKNATGLGTTKQGRAVRRLYEKQLANEIRSARAFKDTVSPWGVLKKHKAYRPRDRAAWRAVKDKSEADLARTLLIAGISVCGSDALGINAAGEKTFLHVAAWIGLQLGRRGKLGLQVGAWGVDMLIRLPIFELGDDDILTLTDDVHDIMDAELAREFRRHPFLSPLTQPPIPWTQVRKGGLPPNHWGCASLIHGHRQSVENAVRKAIGTGRMQPVLDAVNFLQATPFIINTPVYDFLLKSDAAPVVDPRELPSWTRAARKQREGLANLTVWDLDMAVAAGLTVGRFWVPLNLDTRGRLYGIPYFNFTRGDRVRGLFLFADGKPIGIEGLKWLKAHVATQAKGNAWSHVRDPSELTPDARAAWTDDNLDLLLKIGNAVLRREEPATLDWCLRDIDDKYQFIAACAELAQALDQGPGFITKLPLTYDGSNNGLQHLSMMMRDEIGAAYVNLLVPAGLDPPDKADDFYRRVAYRIYNLEPPIIDMGGPICLVFPLISAAIMGGMFDRKIVKQPAMSYFYGAMPESMVKQIDDVLKKRGESSYGAWALACAIYKEIGDMVPRAVAAFRFLRRLARIASKQGKVLRWTTLGFPVFNEYHPPDVEEISVSLKGKRKRVDFVVGDLPGVDEKGAVRAVAANFVHSLDACHLQMVALAAAKEGIPLVSVHDCYGTIAPHAGRLKEIIHEQFIKLHTEHDWLDEARGDLHIDLPEKGNAKIEDISVFAWR